MNIFKDFFGKKDPPKAENNAAPFEKLMSYRLANLQGLGTRAGQEDSFAFVNAMDVAKIKNEGLLAIVADGMGGMQNGKAASELAIRQLVDDFETLDRTGDIPNQLKESVLRASDAVYEGFNGQSGTTIIVCLMYEGKLYFVSVGDSYLYLKRGSSLTRLNKEHTYRQTLYLEEIQSGTMYAESANNDPDGVRLSEFVGKDFVDDVDVLKKPLQLFDGDVILICSDGVGGVVASDRLVEYLSENDPGVSCQKIERDILAQARQHQDNYTALIIKCTY